MQVVRKVKIAALIAVLALISSSLLEVKAQGQFVGSVKTHLAHMPAESNQKIESGLPM